MRLKEPDQAPLPLESAAHAGEKAAPPAGLALYRRPRLGEFVGFSVIIDAGIVGRADDRDNNRRNRSRALLGGSGNVSTRAEQRRGGRRNGFRGRRRRRRHLGGGRLYRRIVLLDQ